MLVSDLSLNLTAFRPENTAKSTQLLNDGLIEKCKQDIKWWDCGAQEYRTRRAAGETPFPPPVQLEGAEHMEIDSPEGHKVSCRVFKGVDQGAKGVLYHIHGGGYVLGSSAGQDSFLHEIAHKTQVVVVSVEYRLAPENPYPAALDDCCLVADWLVKNASNHWGCELKFVGGESAGATLSTLVLMHMRNEGTVSHLRGAILNYGQFDLSGLPSLYEQDDPNKCLILSKEDADYFLDAYLPPAIQRKASRVSPAYNKLHDLVPALFVCGTRDGLIDDSLLMSSKWMLAGNESILKFVGGACHGFMTFDGNYVPVAREGWDIVLEYIAMKLEGENTQ